MAKLTGIMLLQQTEQPALVIEKTSDIENFSREISKGFQKISSYLKELGEIATDIPCVQYPAYEQMTEKNINMAISFYTAKPLPAKEDIQSVILPARKTAVCLHKGNYNELADLYNEMAEWIKAKGYDHSGISIEHYYTAPDVPEEEQITRVVMPLK